MKKLIAAVVFVASTVSINAQVPSAKRMSGTNAMQAKLATLKAYEDDEVKIPIPTGWMVATGNDPAVTAYVNQANSGLLLASNNGYRLALSYRAGQVSGVLGGRFIEVLRIPWLTVDETWDCSLQIGSYPQPAGRALIFKNIFLPTKDPEVRQKCGIKKDSSHPTNAAGARLIAGEERWFAGIFTTAHGGWFFESNGKNCGQKAYTLTSTAKTPEELPIVGDPDLKKTVAEAIQIVDSIYYKRCAPRP